MMLIKVFGIWLMTSSIMGLTPDTGGGYHNGCRIQQAPIEGIGNYAVAKHWSCDEVAEEINRQIRIKQVQ